MTESNASLKSFSLCLSYDDCRKRREGGTERWCEEGGREQKDSMRRGGDMVGKKVREGEKREGREGGSWFYSSLNPFTVLNCSKSGNLLADKCHVMVCGLSCEPD